MGTLSFLSKIAFSWFILARRGGHSTAHGPLTGPWVRKSTLTGKAPFGGGGALVVRFLLKRPLRADRLTGTPLTGRPPYGKAPYGEASYGKAPYELQESLREATGRDYRNWAGISASVP